MKKFIYLFILVILNSLTSAESLMVFKTGNYYGVLDEDTLKIIVKPTFTKIDLSGSTYITETKDGINSLYYKGVKTFCGRERIYLINQDVAVVEKGTGKEELWNLLQKKKIAEISNAYSSDGPVIPVLYFGEKNKIFHFLDWNGNEKFQLELKRVYHVDEKYFVGVLPNFNYAVFDISGNKLSEFSETSQNVSEGLIYGESTNKVVGYFDINGNLKFNINIDRYDGYLHACDFVKGFVLVNTSFEKNEWVILNKNGQQTGSFKAFTCSNFINEFSNVIYKNKKQLTYNFVDVKGKKLSEIDFDYAGVFNKIYANVILDGKSYLINKNGKLISLDSL